MSVGKDGSSLADALRSDQRQRWLAGERVFVEQYVEEHPELRSDPDALFQVVSGEYRLREELGEFPDLSEYAIRFPELSDRISRLASGTEPDDSEARNRSTQATGPQAPAGLHCRFCGHTSPPTDINATGEVRCEHCGKVLLVVEETATYEMTTVAMIGKFELREHVGSGQFGDVWRAFDTDLRREVAIKIPRHMPDDRAMHALFVREARAAARLKHPNIVPVYDVNRDGERVFIVSGYIRGTTLKNWIAQRPFGPREAAELCVTIARAVHHAHQEGIVHRDLKPGNILMDVDGRPHIADFGLAKHSNDDATLTVDGQVLGTPAYMSPEQARGHAHKADRRCDVYSLGVILYELLAGRRPFDSRGEVLTYEVLNIEPPSPRKHNPAIPSDLATICLKAMAKDPAARYPTTDEFADDLQRFLKGEPIRARRLPPWARAARWVRRNPGRAMKGTFVAVMGLLMLALLLYNQQLQFAAQPIYRTVRIQSEPAAETIVFALLDPKTGLPQQDMLTTANGSPAEAVLQAGDYLVVADKPGYGFHEVYRHVPDRHDVTGPYPHLQWTISANGDVGLPGIKIPPLPVDSGMARFDGMPKFEVGTPQVQSAPPHHRSVREFYLDATEVTVGEYQKVKRSLPSRLIQDPPPDNHAVSYVSFDTAVAYAELIGKRLPDEVEFEFAATRGGTCLFPWGNQEAPIDSWPLGAVGIVNRDRLNTSPRIVGLYSNVAEWTMSVWAHYPPFEGRGLTPLDPHCRIVRGGPCSESDDSKLWNDGPRRRVGINRATTRYNIGFRCARSVTPRLRAEDFVTIRKP